MPELAGRPRRARPGDDPRRARRGRGQQRQAAASSGTSRPTGSARVRATRSRCELDLPAVGTARRAVPRHPGPQRRLDHGHRAGAAAATTTCTCRPTSATAERVGARRGAHTVLSVDAAQMHAEGHEFRVSTQRRVAGRRGAGRVPLRSHRLRPDSSAVQRGICRSLAQTNRGPRHQPCGNVTLTGGVGHCAGPIWPAEQKETPCPSSPATSPPSSSPSRRCPAAPSGPSPSPRGTRSWTRPSSPTRSPTGYEVAVFGLGCFWGAEEIYWKTPGVWSTSVGYAGGTTPQPVVRRGLQRPHQPHRGRADRLRPEGRLLRRPGEDVLRGPRPDPGLPPGQRRRHPVPLRDLLHDARAGAGRARADRGLRRGAERRRLGEITTEIRPASETPYYYAEDQHQQYLAKNPFGYRCHANTGVKFPA